MRLVRTALAMGAALFMSAPAFAQPAADTVGAIRARGQLVCSTSPSTVGFSLPDSQGVWRGLDVDYCRAVAVAILGDANRVRIVPSSTQQRFTMLQSGEIDMLSRTTTWTLSREASLGLSFAGINVYDGQGFMVHRDSGVTSARQLDGATVCVQPGTTTELNMTDYFRANRIRFTPVVIENIEEIRSAFINRRCDAYTTDASSLASFRAAQGANAGRYLLLPEIISKEPLGPVVRKGDWRFFDIVRWTHFALVTAEELGITAANIDSFANSNNPDVQRFLGRSGELGQMLGLPNNWTVNVIKAVGNYGEIWERNMTPIGFPRGPNNLWNNGGLQYAPPMR
ncbi:amino acid ABC transporter substrate-binding protein [Falsiroseomonas sp.]|uniref:amino acid ABC transporter substrate-binding protein n=1 Tax=Falsiroseomonas sp. TaxID=2870721 RepID=UPI0034A2EF86